MATTVVNIRDRVPGAVYIGRANKTWKLEESYWANPFIPGKNCTAEDCLESYRNYIRHKAFFWRCLDDVRGRVLACWCKKKGDEPCHGDVIAQMADCFHKSRSEVVRTYGYMTVCTDCGGILGGGVRDNQMKLEVG